MLTSGLLLRDNTYRLHILLGDEKLTNEHYVYGFHEPISG